MPPQQTASCPGEEVDQDEIPMPVEVGGKRVAATPPPAPPPAGRGPVDPSQPPQSKRSRETVQEVHAREIVDDDVPCYMCGNPSTMEDRRCSSCISEDETAGYGRMERAWQEEERKEAALKKHGYDRMETAWQEEERKEEAERAAAAAACLLECAAVAAEAAKQDLALLLLKRKVAEQERRVEEAERQTEAALKKHGYDRMDTAWQEAERKEAAAEAAEAQRKQEEEEEEAEDSHYERWRQEIEAELLQSASHRQTVLNSATPAEVVALLTRRSCWCCPTARRKPTSYASSTLMTVLRLERQVEALTQRFSAAAVLRLERQGMRR